MGDDAIERALRSGPPDEPLYVPTAATLADPASAGVRGSSPRAGRGVGSVLATAAIAAVVLVGVVLFRPAAKVDPNPAGHDLLAEVTAAGRLRIVVTKDAPQVLVPGVGVDGFDIDVARAIGGRLGVLVQIDTADPAEIERGDWADQWDLALDSVIGTADRRVHLGVGNGYYVRSASVYVASSSNIRTLGDLDSARLCVVEGSDAQRWVGGTLHLIGGTMAATPSAPRLTAAPSADVCVAEVRDGATDAFVADPGTETDRSALIALADSPFRGVAGPAVDLSRAGNATLLAAVDRILSDLRADGTLRTLSERRFGGQDLTILP